MSDAGGEFPVPDPACDVALTTDVVRSAYLDSLTHEPPAPPEVQERFRDFLVGLDGIAKKAQSAAPPMPRQQAEPVLGGPAPGMLQGAGGLPT